MTTPRTEPPSAQPVGLSTPEAFRASQRDKAKPTTRKPTRLSQSAEEKEKARQKAYEAYYGREYPSDPYPCGYVFKTLPFSVRRYQHAQGWSPSNKDGDPIGLLTPEAYRAKLQREKKT
jgi:hypothetical protein